jgi:hypothetical protein
MYYQPTQPTTADYLRNQLAERLAELDKSLDRLERMEKCRESYDRAEALIDGQRAAGSPLAWYNQQRLKLARSEGVPFDAMHGRYQHEALEAVRKWKGITAYNCPG